MQLNNSKSQEMPQEEKRERVDKKKKAADWIFRRKERHGEGSGGGGDRKHESAVCQKEGVERQRKGSQDLAITGALTKEFLGSLYCATACVSVCLRVPVCVFVSFPRQGVRARPSKSEESV